MRAGHKNLVICLFAFTLSRNLFGFYYLNEKWNQIRCSTIARKVTGLALEWRDRFIAKHQMVPMEALAVLETVTRVTRKPKVFPKWTVSEGDIHLEPKDLLPEKLVNALQEKMGPLEVSLTPEHLDPPFDIQGYPKGVKGFHLTVGTESDTVLEISFGVLESDPKTLYVERLLSRDPRQDENGGREYQHQGKGLPPLALFEALHTLEDLGRASGATEIRSTGSTTYLGNQLYSRVIKMEPLTPESKAFHEAVDRKFKLARRILPKEFQPYSAGNFTEHLGNYMSGPMRSPLSSWEIARGVNGGSLPKGYEMGRDASGVAQFFYLPGSPERGVFYLDPTDPTQVIDWNDAHRKGLLWLGKKL